ncbi:MAG: TIGR02569 family protein [Pseudonocardiaceae bacterium]
MQPPPEHVRAAFGVREAEPETLPERGLVWRCGDIVLQPVAGTPGAAWVAQTLDTLQADGVRLARPLRSTDGRWVVAGWAASRYLTGRPEPRHDEVVVVSQRLHDATAELARPRFLADRTDLYAIADAAAWGEQQPALDPERGGRSFTQLAGERRPLGLRPQLVHGDLFGNVLFAGTATPAVVGLVPYWRPAEWAAAVVVVDALAWGGADPGLLHRWSSLPEWPQVLLRALLFRIAVHAMHPHAGEESLAGLRRAITLVTQLL